MEGLHQSPDKLRQGFIALAESLLSSLIEVFPECDALDAGFQLFTRIIKGNSKKETIFIRECQQILSKHGEALKKEQEEALFAVAEEMPLLRNIDLRQKWLDPGFQAESKVHFWQYLTSLKIYADLYCSIPSEILGKIESVASRLSNKLQGGQLDFSKLDVRDIGNELLGQLSEEEVKTFEASLPDIFSSISDIASNISSKVGGGQIDPEQLMKTLLERQKDGAPLDVSSIMQNLGGMMPLGLDSPDGMASVMNLLGNMGSSLNPDLLKTSASLATMLEDRVAEPPKIKKKRGGRN